MARRTIRWECSNWATRGAATRRATRHAIRGERSNWATRSAATIPAIPATRGECSNWATRSAVQGAAQPPAPEGSKEHSAQLARRVVGLLLLLNWPFFVFHFSLPKLSLGHRKNQRRQTQSGHRKKQRRRKTQPGHRKLPQKPSRPAGPRNSAITQNPSRATPQNPSRATPQIPRAIDSALAQCILRGGAGLGVLFPRSPPARGCGTRDAPRPGLWN